MIQMNLYVKRKLKFQLMTTRSSPSENTEWKFTMTFKQERRNYERRNSCFRNNRKFNWCRRKKKRKSEVELSQAIIPLLQKKLTKEQVQVVANDQLPNKNTTQQRSLQDLYKQLQHPQPWFLNPLLQLSKLLRFKPNSNLKSNLKRNLSALVQSHMERNQQNRLLSLSLIHISEPTRQAEISYAVFCLKKQERTT